MIDVPSLGAHTAPNELEFTLAAVETRLSLLGDALRDRNPGAIEQHAADLHRALAQAVQRFGQAARERGGVPPALRHRLALASGQVAAQRESLARATAALDRAIDVLMPGVPVAAVYAAGNAPRKASGCVQA